MNPSSLSYQHTCWPKLRQRQPAEIWATAGLQMMPWYNCWGFRPTLKWSSLYIEHIKGVWQTPHAVGKHMDPPSYIYHRTCWPIYGKLVKILGHYYTTGEQVGQLCNCWGALDPPWMISIRTSNIYKVFDNLQMLWMGTWIRRHPAVNTLVGQD